jgi:hypothetical protein
MRKNLVHVLKVGFMALRKKACASTPGFGLPQKAYPCKQVFLATAANKKGALYRIFFGGSALGCRQFLCPLGHFRKNYFQQVGPVFIKLKAMLERFFSYAMYPQHFAVQLRTLVHCRRKRIGSHR